MKTLFNLAIEQQLSIAQLFVRQAHATSSSLHFIDKDLQTTLPYRNLLQQSQQWAAALQEQGVHPGQPTILWFDDESNLIKAFWAVQMAGAIAVPLSAPLQYDEKDEALLKLTSVYQTFDQALILTDLDLPKLQQLSVWTEAVASQRCLTTESLNDSRAQWHEPITDIDDIALLMFSSGSTGSPKGVQLTHRNLLTNLQQIVERSELTNSDKSLSWLPLTHDMGLILFHLCHTLGALEQYKMSPFGFVRDPEALLHWASKLKVTVLGMPNFGFDLLLRSCRVQQLEQWDLSSIRLIYNGAEPIDVALCRRFSSYFAASGLAQGVISPGYGIAEACVTASQHPHSHLLQLGELPAIGLRSNTLLMVGSKVELASPSEPGGREVACLGPVMPGMSVRILDERGRELPELTLGHVELAGANVTRGYWNHPPSEWCRTGDLGFIYNQQIYLTGRDKDIIFINGRNYFSNDLETYLAQRLNWPANQMVVVGFTDSETNKERVVLFYRAPKHASIGIEERLEAELERKLAYPVSVIKLAKLPKTTSGKLRRYQLRKALQQGKFKDRLTSRLNAVKTKLSSKEKNLLKMVERILDTDLKYLDPSQPLSRYGLDSTGFAQLSHRLNLNIARLIEASSLTGIAALIGDSDLTIVDADEVKETESLTSVPLSQNQVMLWTSYLLEAPTIYNECYSLRFAGTLDSEKFVTATERAIARHPMLHVVVDDTQQPRLRLRSDLRAQIKVQDFCGNSMRANEHITELSRQYFDLRQELPIRVHLLKLSLSVYELVICAHHLVVDGWSFKLLLQDIFDEYYQPGSKETNDPGLWKIDENPLSDQQSQYWVRLLEGVDAIRLAGHEEYTERGDCLIQQWVLDADLSAKADRLASSLNGSVYSLFSSLWCLLLGKLAGVEKPLMGALFSGRACIEDEQRIGYYAQTSVLAASLKENISFTSLHQSIRSQINYLLTLPRVSLEQINQAVSVDLPELLQVVYVHQNMPSPRLGSIQILSQKQYRTKARTDLYLTSEWVNDELLLNLEFDSHRFTDIQVKYIGQLFEHLLRQVCTDPKVISSQLDWICPQQRSLLKPYYQTKAPIDLELSFSQRFNRAVELYPDHIALSDGDISYSYWQLKQAVNLLGANLLSHGVKRGDRICILTERSSQHVVALLATLQVGAVFISIDPGLPKDRIRFIADDCRAKILLTTSSYQAGHDVTCLLTDEQKLLSFNCEQPKELVDCETISVTGSDGAYLIYTSGSSGKPKGVFNDQKSLANLVEWVQRAFNYRPGEKICQFAPFSFDVSIAEILPSLISGLQVHILPTELRNAAETYLKAQSQLQTNIATLTPAFFYQINQMPTLARQCLKAMRLLILGGEALKTDEVIIFQKQHPHIQLANVYGPTETTVLSSYYLLPRIFASGKPWLPLGYPVANTEILILDENQQLCPLMTTGEIYISGAGLSKGYWQDPEKTEEAFMFLSPDGLKKRRFYRTGDMAFLNMAGQLEFVGRRDNQVKLRGFRIELGEIEKKLSKHENIDQVAVVVTPLSNGESTLAAYYCGRKTDKSEFSRFLANCLPSYMIPAFYILLETLPLTHNKKVDRSRLPSPDSVQDLTIPLIPPRGKKEELIAEVWRDVLKLERIGREDNFYDLGGSSLSAAQMVFKLRESTGLEFQLCQLPQNPTIAEMAAIIPDQATSLEEIKSQPQQSRYPASDAQARMVYLDLSQSDSAENNIPMALLLGNKLDPSRLEEALNFLAEQHPLLRCRFELDDDGLYQRYDVTDSVDFTTIESQDPERIEETGQAFFRLPFSLLTGPLWRARLCCSEQKQWLLLSFHHSIVDGVSLVRLVQDLNQAYVEKTITPINDELSYADYSLWQRNRLGNDGYRKEYKYWQKRQADHHLLQLPLIGSSNPGNQGRQFVTELSVEQSHALQIWCKKEKVSLFSLFLLLFGYSLGRLCDQNRFNVGISLSGRSHSRLQNTIGNFVNTLPLLFVVEPESSLKSAAMRIQQGVNEMIDVQDYPLNWVMKQTRSDLPLFNVLFNQEVVPQTLEFNQAPAELLAIGTQTAKFPLLLSLLIKEHQLCWRIEYQTELLEGEWIDQLQLMVGQMIKGIIDLPEGRMKEIERVNHDIMALLDDCLLE